MSAYEKRVARHLKEIEERRHDDNDRIREVGYKSSFSFMIWEVINYF
jgi:hypothetical protein